MRIGELLVELGRITAGDVDRALAYQREHGGLLGDALIRLGALTREELRWSLASQYSIPFVHLRPESIDPALAAHVPAAWARENLILPVLRSGDAVTVVLADPTDLEKLEKLQQLTGFTAVEPAISSPDSILELIDAVYRHAPGRDVGVLQMMAEALAEGAGTLGISVREGRAAGWYRVAEVVHRTLRPGWEAELQQTLHPFVLLFGIADGRPRSWAATLHMADGDWVVACSALGYGSRLEWTARVVRRAAAGVARARVDPSTLVLAAQAIEAGRLLVRVRAPEGPDPEADLAEAATALLPGLLLRRDVRSIHRSDRPAAMPAGVLSMQPGGTLRGDLAAIAALEPEAVTVAVDDLAAADVEPLQSAAPIAVVLVRGSAAPVYGALDLYLRDVDGLLWTHRAGDDAAD